MSSPDDVVASGVYQRYLGVIVLVSREEFFSSVSSPVKSSCGRSPGNASGQKLPLILYHKKPREILLLLLI